MILRTLGITGSACGPQSPSSTYLVQVAAGEVAAGIALGTVAPTVPVRNWNLVLDLGNGGLGMLLQHCQVKDVDAIALSHLHPDHCADLSGFYVHLKYHPRDGCAFSGQMPRVPVYGPRGVQMRIEEMCGISDGSSMQGPFTFSAFTSGQQVAIGPLTLTPTRVRHSVEAYALQVNGPSSQVDRLGQPASLVYTGDTDFCQDLVEAARHADVLLAEAAFVEGRDDAIEGLHLTGKRAGSVASFAQVKSLLLTHIPVWNDPQEALAEARQTYDGHLELAVHDGCYLI